jgi:hypothetical protein
MAISEIRPLSDLLKTAEPADLGPGPRAGVESKANLEAKLQTIFKNSKLPRERQELVRGLILLWHDHHDDAHKIVQDIENPDGSFIHGIVHRREPDYSNSKYWFRRVGKHAAFAGIAERAAHTLHEAKSPLADQLLPARRWDAMAFIDACARALQNRAGDADVALLCQIQKIETECLLEYLGS